MATRLPCWAEQALAGEAPAPVAAPAVHERFEIVESRLRAAWPVVGPKFIRKTKGLDDVGRFQLLRSIIGCAIDEAAQGSAQTRAARDDVEKVGHEIARRAGGLLELIHRRREVIEEFGLVDRWRDALRDLEVAARPLARRIDDRSTDLHPDADYLLSGRREMDGVRSLIASTECMWSGWSGSPDGFRLGHAAIAEFYNALFAPSEPVSEDDVRKAYTNWPSVYPEDSAR